MRESLERIRIWLEREAPNLASALQPGLCLADMQQIMGTKAAQYRIPEEVVELYEWRNGQSGEVSFFDILRFQPFEDAVEYANLVEEYSDGEFPLMIFQELNNDAGYRFKCGAEERKHAPAYRWIHGEEQLETASLNDLLSAVAAALESGVFQPNDQGELNTDHDAWNAIIVLSHPERRRGINALLNRRWEELNGEQLRDAFYDLWRMNHPETAALLREYIEDGPDCGLRDWESFQAVLGTGIGIQDEWSRECAQSLILSQDSRVQHDVQMLLAWRWRGELSLSAKHVDGLIAQVRASAVSDSDNRERAMLLERAGDRRAIPALLRLLSELPATATERQWDCGVRDVRIAALRALGRLQAVEGRQLYLTIAETDSDPGTRISAVKALLELGFEDARVEAAAKKWSREILLRFANMEGRNEPPTLRRWIEEVKQSFPSERANP